MVVCYNITLTNLFSQRASITGLVFAGFGLSAFFFNTLANTFLGSTTSTFLLILALGTSSMMVLGFFFVRPIPLPDKASSQPLEDGDILRDALLPAPEYHNPSSTTPLIGGSMKDRHPRYTRTDIDIHGEYSNSTGVDVTEVTHRGINDLQTSGRKTTLNIHGKALCYSLDFWLLFGIYSMRMFSFSAFFFPSD